MGDDRVDTFEVYNHIECRGPCRPYYIGLDAFQVICRVAAFPDVIPHLGDRVQSREVIWTAVDKIKADAFTWLRLQKLSAFSGVDRIVSKNSAVEDYIIVFAVEHRLHVVRVCLEK